MSNGQQTRWLTDAGLALGLVVALVVIAVAEPRSRGDVITPPVEVASAEQTNTPVNPVSVQPAPAVTPKVDPTQEATPPTPAAAVGQFALPPTPVAAAGQFDLAPPPREKLPRTPSQVVMTPVAVLKGEARQLRLGVNPQGSDNVGAVLTGLGKGYEYTDLTNVDLESGDRLKKYDVVFLNCGGAVGTNAGGAKAVREFVSMGGTLYASDLQYEFVSKVFPLAANPVARYAGVPGQYKAEVVDGGLQKVLGKTVNLKFDAGGWAAAAFGGKTVSVLLRAAGDPALKKGTPLLVKFSHGKGTVIYTSFHNSAIADDTAKKLLRFLVFSAVVADAESRINAALTRDKFAVASSEILTATANDWSDIRSYTLGRGGKFRVAVGFHNDNAEVLLTVTSPEGADVTFEHEGKDTFVVDLVNAPPGEWKLRVTAKKIPNPNFPITLVVAEPKK